MLSSPEAFAPMRDAFLADPRFVSDWTIDATFQYDSLLPLRENGKRLADHLRTHHAERERVDLIAHSMGGLISRIALLEHGETLAFVRRLIMLATPNFGAMTYGQLSHLAYLAGEEAKRALPVFWRDSGIVELTRATETIRELLTDDMIARTVGVDYVTVPAMLYHPDRPAPKSSGGLTERILNLVAKLGSLGLGYHLEMPHDGIVEESSVSLMSSIATRTSEKTYVLGKGLSTYAHVHCPDCLKINHVQIQGCVRVGEIVRDLALADDLPKWHSALHVGSVDPVVKY
jgi:hypothetical protein